MRGSLPKAVRDCCAALRGAGFEACPVGGCVRDLLLGRPVRDWDAATSARPEQIEEIFPAAAPTGRAYGTVTVEREGIPVQLTTFRREGPYSDGRRPDWVEFHTDLTSDLARRDFTVNAMALGERGEVIAPFGGQEDLARRLLRTVGDPMERFSQDALRILRGVRLAAQLGFSLDGPARAAMAACAGGLARLSPQRVGREMEAVLLSPRPQAAGELVALGALNRFWDGWRPCQWETLAQTPPEEAARWGAFCALTGCPISALPVTRRVRLAVEQPLRAQISGLALSGGQLREFGLEGPEIGRAQRYLARHVQRRPEDNTPAALLRALAPFL
ncbi:MAG: tRNA nucleotidyltransferase [Oscillospiraceae bacterium]|nr:tRNA nucleotidyltransferase [Oscillospiraceae bacterium]